MSEIEKDVPGAPNLPFGMTRQDPVLQFTASKDLDPDKGDWPHQITVVNYDLSSEAFDANVQLNLPNHDCQSYDVSLVPEDYALREGENSTREQAIASLALRLLEDSYEIQEVEIAKQSAKKTAYKIARRLTGGFAMTSAGVLGISILAELVVHDSQSPLRTAVGSVVVGLLSAQGFARSHERYTSVSDSIEYAQKNNKAINKLIQEISTNGVQIIDDTERNEQ